MFHVDPALLAPEIAALLVSRGQGVPPLLWNTRPNRIAAKTLDDLALPRLFDRPSVPNAQMGAAVRSLLYLWNGWPNEALREAESAGESEKAFIAALCARQAGEPIRAKELLQGVGEHPIFHPLGQHVLEGLSGSHDPLLVRFQQTIALGALWEPFLFVDLFEQARVEKLKEETVQVICTLQSLEFEYLLKYCYECATGEPLAGRAAAREADPEANRQRTRELAEKHKAKIQRQKKEQKEKDNEAEGEDAPKPATPAAAHQVPMVGGGAMSAMPQVPVVGGRAPASATQVQPSPDTGRSARGAGISISCPKCRHSVCVPAAMRGTRQACERCGAAFLVPAARTARNAPLPANLSPPPPGHVLLRCPRCADVVTLPESTRGKADRCPKCGAAFLVPRKKGMSSAAGAPNNT